MNISLLLIAVSIAMTFAIFTYNMTEHMKDESRILYLCIYSDIKIPNCETMYGGINTTYGEAIK